MSNTNFYIEELKDFINNEMWPSDIDITRHTRIEADLGITGDDAEEFIIAYSKKYNVDVSEFMAADYFDAEGISLILSRNPNNKHLTIEHLIRGIITGKLNEEIINNNSHYLRRLCQFK